MTATHEARLMSAPGLSVLVVTPVGTLREHLALALRDTHGVDRVVESPDLGQLTSLTPTARINAVLIDLFSFDPDVCVREIFRVRERDPGVVFVLVVDPVEAKRRSGELFRASEHRLRHYYVLDKTSTDIAGELRWVILHCQYDLALRLVEMVGAEMASATEPSRRGHVEDLLDHAVAKEASASFGRGTRHRPVLLVARPRDMEDVALLKRLLRSSGYGALVGTGNDGDHTQMESAGAVICLLRRHHELQNGGWLPSLDVMESKTLAVAAGRTVIVLAEKGLTELGSLGTGRVVYFTEGSLEKSARRAINLLSRSRAGEESN